MDNQLIQNIIIKYEDDVNSLKKLDTIIVCIEHGIRTLDDNIGKKHYNCKKCILQVNSINIKEIPGFENYFVSKDGDLYSKIYKKKLFINIERYKANNQRVYVCLNKNSKTHTLLLARIIALTFLTNPLNLPEVNHIDGNYYNNKLNNLEWSSRLDNQRHAKENGLLKLSDTRRIIQQFNLNNEFIAEYKSIVDAAKSIGIHKSAIDAVLSGKRKLCKNFIWRYKEYEIIVNEIWKYIIIENIKTDYKISNYGRVLNPHGKLLKGKLINGNYIRIYISYNKNNIILKERFRLHYLVAITFIPNPENKSKIDHIDTNPKNNKVDNLRWCTDKENMNNEITLSKHEKPVEQLDDNYNVLNTFKSITKASKYMNQVYGFRSIHIGEVCKGKLEKAGGFRWRYK